VKKIKQVLETMETKKKTFLEELAKKHEKGKLILKNSKTIIAYV